MTNELSLQTVNRLGQTNRPTPPSPPRAEHWETDGLQESELAFGAGRFQVPPQVAKENIVN